jgi:hypothetical protein
MSLWLFENRRQESPPTMSLWLFENRRQESPPTMSFGLLLSELLTPEDDAAGGSVGSDADSLMSGV